jgi:hypothetical protein
MMEVLFPHMNPADREVFLLDIKTCDPEKFAEAWHSRYIQARNEFQKCVSLAANLGTC